MAGTNIDTCRETKVSRDGKVIRKGGAWALEHEGNFYCPFTDRQARCAGDEKRAITRRTYSSYSGWKEETAEYHICGLLNNEQSEEDGRRK